MNKIKAYKKLYRRLIQNETGCLVWQGAKSSGYGCIYIEGKNWWTHRLAWILNGGELLEGQCICHTCDNPPCCNPAHLFQGSHGDNFEDMREKGRQAAGESHGCARLTKERVRKIRERYQGKRGDLKQIAEEEGMSIDTVRKIVRGKLWMKGVESIDWNNAPAEKRKDMPLGRIEGTMLTVIGPGPLKGRDATVMVRCDCGTEKPMRKFNVRDGRTVSCGCYGRKAASERCRKAPPRLGTGK